MRWALRFLLWAAPLTWLAGVSYVAYMQLLIRAALAIYALFGIRIELSEMDVLAPVDLALFGAMVLASHSLSWKERLGRLAAGIGILMVVEVALVVAGIAAFLMPGAPTGPSRAFVVGLIDMLGWVGAPLVWLALFRREVVEWTRTRQRPAGASSASPRARRHAVRRHEGGDPRSESPPSPRVG